MSILVRAIIVGFGYKLGVELGKMVTSKLKPEESGESIEEEEEVPDGIKHVTSNEIL